MNQNNVKTEDILKRYSNSFHLGGGGQKEVFLIDENGSKFVVKIGHYSSPLSLERIKREVSILNEIDSHYFPKQYGFEVIDDQRFVIYEEYIDGRPLEDCIGEYSEPSLAFELLFKMLNGLVGLWQRNVVHRDLKPANIIITDGAIKIIDLGIARFLNESSLTQTFAPFGPCTPNYASPEQLYNKKREIDHRTDQFTLGIVVSQLILGGAHPFDPRISLHGSTIPENILAGKWAKKEVELRVSESEYNILKRMLSAEPFMRYRLPEDLINSVLLIIGGKACH